MWTQNEDRSASVEGISIYNPAGGTLRAADGLVRILGSRASPRFIDMMGVQPLAVAGFIPRMANPRLRSIAVTSAKFPSWE